LWLYRKYSQQSHDYNLVVKNVSWFFNQCLLTLQSRAVVSYFIHMNQVKTAIAIVLGFALVACQSNSSTGSEGTSGESTEQATTGSSAIADVEKQIMAVHDSVMPAMSDLMRLRKQINQQLTELDAKPASKELTQRKEQGRNLTAELTKAEEGMMDWMHQYNGDTLKTLSEDKALDYLKDQHQKVNAMSQLMRKSITDAQTYLK
jgi:hypothetical protein